MRQLGEFSLVLMFLLVVPTGLGTPIGYMLTGMPKSGDYQRVLLMRIISYVVGFSLMIGLVSLPTQTQLEVVNFIEKDGLIFTIIYLVIGVVINQVVVTSTINELTKD